MPEPNLFKIFTARLNKIGIRYMVTGAVAAIIYGEPRLTHDIDLVIELKLEEIKKIEEVFPSEEFYCPPEEAIKLEIKRPSRGHFNIIHRETGFKADCYLMGNEELHLWGISKRKELDIEGDSIPNQEDHAFYAWVNWSSDTGCSPLVGVSMEPRALPVGLHWVASPEYVIVRKLDRQVPRPANAG